MLNENNFSQNQLTPPVTPPVVDMNGYRKMPSKRRYEGTKFGVSPKKKSRPSKERIPQPKNTVAMLNELRHGLVYKLESQTGPVHAPLFTISVEPHHALWNSELIASGTGSISKVFRTPPDYIRSMLVGQSTGRLLVEALLKVNEKDDSIAKGESWQTTLVVKVILALAFELSAPDSGNIREFH